MNVGILEPPRLRYLAKREELDHCLDAIEGAIEKGQESVSRPLAASLQALLPSVQEGMPLTTALERVFAAQQRLFALQTFSEPSNGDVLPVGMADLDTAGCAAASRAVHMSKDEAQLITGRIKAGLGELPLLLLEAHRRRAWIALNYTSWERYVRVEFTLSRSRSYELLDQARVIEALSAAVGDRPFRHVSALAASEIKPYLSSVVAEVRKQVSLAGSELADAQVEQLVRDAVARARLQATNSKKELDRTGRHGSELSSLVESIRLLAHQPPAAEVLRGLSDQELSLLAELPEATRWLRDLLGEWGRGQPRRITLRPKARAERRGPRGRPAVSFGSGHALHSR